MHTFIDRLKTMPAWQFISIFVLLAIGISELLIIVQSYWLHGTIRQDFLIVGFITPAIDGLIIVSIIAYLLQRLRRQEFAHQQAEQAAQLGHWEFDTASQRARWSEQLKQLLGVSSTTDLGPELLRKLIIQEDQPIFDHALQNAQSGGQGYDIEYRIQRPDGEIRWLNCKAVTELNHQGKVRKLVGITQDITERKNMELALRESQQRLMLAGQASYDLIYEWDVASNQIRWFGDIDTLLGYPKGSLNSDIQTWLNIIHPDDLPQMANAVDKHRCATEAISYHYRVRHKNGHYRHWDDHALPLINDEGKPYRWIGVCTDITETIEAKLALEEHGALLRTVLDEMPDVVVLKDHKGDFLIANQTVANLYNTTPDAMVGKNDADFGVPKDMAEFFRRNVISIMQKGETEIVFEDSRDAASGETRHFRSIKKPFVNAAGENQILVIAQDVTELIRAQEKVAENEATLRTILDNVDAYIYMKDTDGNYLFANRAVRKLWGTDLDSLVGFGDEKFFNAETAQNIRHNDRKVLQQGLTLKTEETNTLPDGKTKAVYQSTKLPLKRDNGEIYALCGISVDITQQKQQQQHLEHIAHYDDLTELPNRVLLADRLHQAMVQAQRRQQRVALVYLDLDGFKPINDSMGHHIGDQFLRAVSVNMKNGVREGDTVARIGGDEFVAVLLDFPCGEFGKRLLDRLLNAIASPIELNGQLLRVTCSMGVSLYPQGEDIDPDQLLRQADQAMYQAKMSGKNRYQFFDSAIDRSMRGHLQKVELIQQALTENAFHLYYQPKVNMRSGDIVGVEALLRWQDPKQGLMYPNDFLPSIENHMLSVRLGNWVMENAVRQLADWEEQGFHGQVSINVDSLQLEQADFVSNLKKLLQHYKVTHPQRLQIEILETSAINEFDDITQLISDCKALGVSFALDDFGTGYSSLTYLKRLPVVDLKIDRSFVRDMLVDPDDLAILEGVIGLAEAFNLKTIAEGVESIEHGHRLLELGCELAQGYAIAPAMPAEAFSQWRKEWQSPWKEEKT